MDGRVSVTFDFSSVMFREVMDFVNFLVIAVTFVDVICGHNVSKSFCINAKSTKNARTTLRTLRSTKNIENAKNTMNAIQRLEHQER